jgi:hypothetical protein
LPSSTKAKASIRRAADASSLRAAARRKPLASNPLLSQNIVERQI